MAKSPFILTGASSALGALSGFLAIFSTLPAHGCGGWDEDPPPLLPYYLGQLPAKSFGEIYRETQPPRAKPAPVDATTVVEKVAADLPTASRSSLLARIDDALSSARDLYETGEECNFLHDARDAVASAGTNPEVADYLRWRLTHASWFYLEKPKTESYPEPSPRPALSSELTAELERKIKDASPAMLPQWLYARAALDFIQGDRVKCQPQFERVWKEFPAHPRAEIALYMSARCLRALALRSSYDYDYNPKQTQADREAEYARREQQKTGALPEAVAQFQQYLTKYPQGRFTADAHGWLGGLKLAQGDRLASFQHFAAQLEIPGHPEVAKSALFMCEDVLANSKADEEALFAEAARHPVAAMGMTYLALNMANARSIEEDKNDGNWSQAREYALATSRTKRWRQIVLPKLAAQVVAHKSRYAAGDWPPRYLAMLAQAASAEGKQDDAIALTEMPNHGTEGSDDLLLARATAQQRAGKASAALETYRQLLAKFPQSQLARGVRLKLALALQDDHQAGAAWLALRQLLAEVTDEKNQVGYSAPYPPPMAALTLSNSFAKEDITAAEADQIEQLIAGLANFAPLAELAAPLQESSTDEATKLELRALLAQRCLAQEDFARAKQFMSPAQFTLSTGPLEPLMTQVAAAKTPRAKAQAMDAIGEAWAKLRGQMLAHPLQINSDEQAALRLRVNGKTLGCAHVNEELEERDELRHASRWWMRAARLQPGTALAAAARWKALAAMPQIASGSQFAFTRAGETDAAHTSRELYERLRKECPKSPEARIEAAYWSFPQPAKALAEGEFAKFEAMMERDREAIGMMGWTVFDYGAFGLTRDFTQDDSSGSRSEAVIRELLQLASDLPLAQFAAKVQSLQKEYRDPSGRNAPARYRNLLDDLADFLQQPKITPEALRAYVELRLRFDRFLTNQGKNGEEDRISGELRMDELIDDASLQPHREYVDFIKAVRAGRGTIDLWVAEKPDDAKDGVPLSLSSADYAKLQGAMSAYIKSHPRSAKNEAALFVQIRAGYWLTTPLLSAHSFRRRYEPTPQTPASDLDPTLRPYWRAPFDPKPLQKLLARYDREYPHGRYAADVANYRADLLCRVQDWSPALDLTLATLADATHPELQPEAALRLANIFAELAHGASRPALLAAIRARPAAIQRLQQYLGKTWTQSDHPLRYLGQYLGDQLGFAYVEPPPEKDAAP